MIMSNQNPCQIYKTIFHFMAQQKVPKSILYIIQKEQIKNIMKICPIKIIFIFVSIILLNFPHFIFFFLSLYMSKIKLFNLFLIFSIFPVCLTYFRLFYFPFLWNYTHHTIHSIFINIYYQFRPSYFLHSD